MTQDEKAIEIIEQGGACDGISCDFGEQNECPIFRMCELSGGNSCKSESKVSACREFVGSMKPSKTLLDEFAKEAMGKLIEISSGTTMPREELGYVYAFISEQAWCFAAAMMKERARRDEMGNVKEVK